MNASRFWGGGCALFLLTQATLGQVFTIGADVELAGEHVFDDGLHVPAGVEIDYRSDLRIRARGDIVIDGRVLGEPGAQQGANLMIESDGVIRVNGSVVGAPGRHGALGAHGSALTGLDESAEEWLAHEVLVWELEISGYTGDANVDFAGGDGGAVTLRAPLVIIDGRVAGGAGGDGARGGAGGAGGPAVVDGPARWWRLCGWSGCRWRRW